jgi:hypothetical protein
MPLMAHLLISGPVIVEWRAALVHFVHLRAKHSTTISEHR